ncbi:AMP-binding protein [Novosphingobium sp. JCM 18896]|uniref:AMP-binding protein n=1 Tax=Novosphingobium sp. JCM 18896 TaxID=2989731 RepID=UPI002222F673|nr:AMP-binding protein [Novosphingobium sp. JCM 18896]MCW1428210.1 AMP-binding protein [Novosphingobium sp. JCM 18896]
MTDNANIFAHFLAVAEQAGDKPFLVENGATVLTFADLDARTGRLAARLQALGGKTGERIVVQVDKSPENVLLYLAAERLGMVYVPLNTAYTAGELAYFLGDAEPAVVVCRPADEAAVRDLMTTGTLVTLGTDGQGSLLDDLPDTVAPVAARTATDLAAILYTSGTTGRSKGAMLTHANLLSNALTLKDLWGWQADDVLIHILPIYHVHGLFVALHGALLAGATVLFHRGFDPAAVVADIARGSVLMGVPTHYTRLTAAPELTPASAGGMRLFLSGSAPLLAEAHQRFEEKTGQRILERYGMTETGMITSNPYRGGERVAGTVGYPLPGVEVRLRGDDGDLVNEGPGVLEVRGPNVFAGYWRMPEKTAQEIREDGFFITGDVATQEADGRVTLVGRAKDLIIAGGLNIYPKEIEEAIDALPGVDESAVIGVPHADMGEGVVAVVVPQKGASVTEDEVRAALEGQLARFKQPRRVIVVEALPRNAMGKVQKAALRADYAGLFT